MSINKVLIGLPLASTVSAEFFKSFLPAVNLMPEEGAIHIQHIKWQNIVKARNDIVEAVLVDDFTHLFFMDSDMLFPENTLPRLLQHDLDVVGGLYCRKLPPYYSTVFDLKKSNGKWKTFNPSNSDGVIEVIGIATGCMLIKREVLEGLEWPYFWYKKVPYKEKAMMTEDVYFCHEVRKAGFNIYLDSTIQCGHVGEGLVEPVLGDKREDFQVRIEMV